MTKIFQVTYLSGEELCHIDCETDVEANDLAEQLADDGYQDIDIEILRK